MILPQSFVLYSLIECLISIDIFSLTMFMKTVCQVIFMNRKNIRRHCPCSGVTMCVKIFIQDRSLTSNFVKIFFHMLKIWRFPNFLQNSQDPKCCRHISSPRTHVFDLTSCHCDMCVWYLLMLQYWACEYKSDPNHN